MIKTKVPADLLERAIAREPKAVREFVRVLEPVFRVRIGRVLLPDRKTSRDEIRDLCQETLIALIVDSSMLARLWDPSRGVPFEYYAGRIAERRALDCLRKKTEELWADDQPRDVLRPEDDSSPERRIEDQDFSDKVLARAREEQAEFGRQMFDLLAEAAAVFRRGADAGVLNRADDQMRVFVCWRFGSST